MKPSLKKCCREISKSHRSKVEHQPCLLEYTALPIFATERLRNFSFLPLKASHSNSLSNSPSFSFPFPSNLNLRVNSYCWSRLVELTNGFCCCLFVRVQCVVTLHFFFVFHPLTDRCSHARSTNRACALTIHLA